MAEIKEVVKEHRYTRNCCSAAWPDWSWLWGRKESVPHVPKAECILCFDTFPQDTGTVVLGGTNCSHTCCWSCACELLTQALLNRKYWFPLRCPVVECRSAVTFDTITTIWNHLPETRISLEELQRIYVLNSITCLVCPHCNTPSISREGNPLHGDMAAQCPHCKKAFCAACGGMTSCRLQRDAEIDYKTRAALPLIGIVYCPGCAEGIQRNGGCNHMIHSCFPGVTVHFCARCGTQLSPVNSSFEARFPGKRHTKCRVVQREVSIKYFVTKCNLQSH